MTLQDHFPPFDEPARAAAPSVLRALNAVRQQLAGFHAPLVGDDGIDLRNVARELLHALDLDTDVALACVLRSQVAGSYALRHSVETAVVAAVAARRLRVRPAYLLSITAAALALHATGRHDDDAHVRHAASRALDDCGLFAGLLRDHAPDHQPGEPDIIAGAQLLRMADRYCAAVSPRNYRRALLPDDALRRVLADAPDPALAQAFDAAIGPYPPGTVVRLSTGETAVVMRRDGHRPEVLCLLDLHDVALAVPVPRRIDGTTLAIATALGEDDADLRIAMKPVWGPLASL